MPEQSRDAGSSSNGGLVSRLSLRSRFSGGSDRSVRGGQQHPTLSTAELYKEQGVPTTKQKCKACIIGAFVADSAGVSLDRLSTSVFQSLVGLPEFDQAPEFFSASSKIDDAVTQSRLSIYGNENLPLLQSLVTHGGLDGQHYTKTSYEFLKKYGGKKSHLAQRCLQAFEKGAYFPAGVPVNTMQCLLKVPFLVARYAGKKELGVKLKDAVRAHQHTNESHILSLALANILERVVLGTSIMDALSWAQSDGNLDSVSQRHVQTVLQSMSMPHSVFTAKMGRSDKLPGVFLTGLHAAATSSSFVEAVRSTLKAGGSGMCGRAQLAGAFLAAEAGLESVPQNWIDRVAKFDEYEELADRIVSQRAIITIMAP